MTQQLDLEYRPPLTQWHSVPHRLDPLLYRSELPPEPLGARAPPKLVIPPPGLVVEVGETQKLKGRRLLSPPPGVLFNRFVTLRPVPSWICSSDTSVTVRTVHTSSGRMANPYPGRTFTGSHAPASWRTSSQNKRKILECLSKIVHRPLPKYQLFIIRNPRQVHISTNPSLFWILAADF